MILKMDNMVISRLNKFWIVVTLCSFLLYVLYWLSPSLQLLYTYFANATSVSELLRPYFIADYLIQTIGQIFRFIGVSIALISAYLIWRPNPRPFSMVKKKVVIALLFEATYYLAVLPISILYILRETFAIVGLTYLLQILLVSPILIIVGLKILHTEELIGTGVLKWVCFGGIFYLGGIWVNNVFRWLSMTGSTGLSFLFSGINSLGFLNSIATLSLSLVFAVIGSFYLLKKRVFRTRIFAIALILLGLHFVGYVLFSTVTGALSYLLLTEIWPITLLGLGLSMLRGKNASI
jgi:hypothetical protein